MIQFKSIKDISPEEIQALANNYHIKKNLRNFFPFPYSIQDAVSFISLALAGRLGHVFAIMDNNCFIGVASLIPQDDEHRNNAEIGYWIGEPYWGQGYATEAVKLLVQLAFTGLNIIRVYAYVYSFNLVSMKVLEKSGFHREAILKSSVIKEGEIYDEHLYCILSELRLKIY